MKRRLLHWLVLPIVVILAIPHSIYMIDETIGIVMNRQLGSETEIVAPANRSSSHLNLVFVGHVNDGVAVLDALWPHLGEFAEEGDWAVVNYPQNNFNQDEVNDAVVTWLVEKGYETLTLGGLSMGGQVIADLLRYRLGVLREHKIKVVGIAFCAVPMSARQLAQGRLGARNMLKVEAHMPAGRIGNGIRSWLVGRDQKKWWRGTTDDDLIKVHYRAMADYPVAGARAQARYMLAFKPLGRYELEWLIEEWNTNVVWLQNGSAKDPIVSNNRARNAWGNVFGRSFTVIDDPNWPQDRLVHAPVPESPQGFIEAMRRASQQ